MKVIDLLNKIANGEKIPEKIKYLNQVFELTNNKVDWYCYDYHINLLGNEIALHNLNDEIEIIEDTPKEDKKIEHLKLHAPYPECTDDRFEDVENKLNEIIDRLNGDSNE